MSHESLLDIQRLDVENDQLHHRRINMEERGALEVALAEKARHQVEIDAVAAARVEVANRQRRLEDEAQIMDDKAQADHKRLYSGELQGLKDLEALQHEISTLRSRQSGFEDEALEAMEESEELSARIRELEAARGDVDARVESLEFEITSAEEEIDRKLGEVAASRTEAVEQLDQELVARYESLRPGFGAATVVRFNGSNCAGCPSIMPAMEVDRMKRDTSDIVLECSECGRMVVR